jgi:uncharacterized membrane protein YoaK (UPF0700 family)
MLVALRNPLKMSAYQAWVVQLPTRSIVLRNVLVILLACVASSVDAFSYLKLERVFPANMTGNTVQLGLAIARSDWHAFSRSGVALLGFVIGGAVGALLVRKVQRAAWSASMTQALLVELLVLGVTAALYLASDPRQNEGTLLVLIALGSAAMGLQSSAIQGLSIAGVATTYITGTMTTALNRVVQRARYTAGLSAEKGTGSWLLILIWSMYRLAAIGTVATTSISTGLALGVPITVLAAVVTIAWVWATDRASSNER